MRGLQERVEGGGKRLLVRGQAVELGVQGLGVDRHGAAAGAVAVLGCCLAPDGEVDGDVAGSSAGDLVGEHSGEVVHRGGVGRRRNSRDAGSAPG